MKLSLTVLITFLSLNSFASMTAAEAKKATEQTRSQELFQKIEEATFDGSCFVDLDINSLPKNYDKTLKKLGYKLEYYEFKKVEHIQWCD